MIQDAGLEKLMKASNSFVCGSAGRSYWIAEHGLRKVEILRAKVRARNSWVFA